MDLSAYWGVGVERTLTTDLSHSLGKKNRKHGSMPDLFWRLIVCYSLGIFIIIVIVIIAASHIVFFLLLPFRLEGGATLLIC